MRRNVIAISDKMSGIADIRLAMAVASDISNLYIFGRLSSENSALENLCSSHRPLNKLEINLHVFNQEIKNTVKLRTEKSNKERQRKNK